MRELLTTPAGALAVWLIAINLVTFAVYGADKRRAQRGAWRRWEDGMSIAVSDTLRTVWAVLVLLVSMAFLVGDSYNPFLYFRF